MTKWDATQYMKFATERGKPCADLIARIEMESPARIADLGCGPGNSTEQLHARWQNAHITGVDSSTEMLDKAKADHPDWMWQQADIANWAKWHTAGPFELVFSNAALHWVKNHEYQFPRLFDVVAEGGALAVQMPNHLKSVAHQQMAEVAALDEWNELLRPARFAMTVHTTDFYRDLLTPLAQRVDVWEHTYEHQMDSADGVVEWLLGTGMRPYLDRLKPEQHPSFKQQCRDRFATAFPAGANGKITMLYPRLFIVAYRK